MNEGHLGTYSFGGERAATDDHPVVIHYLPLAADVAAKSTWARCCVRWTAKMARWPMPRTSLRTP